MLRVVSAFSASQPETSMPTPYGGPSPRSDEVPGRPPMRQGVATRLMLDAVTRAALEGESWIEVTANQHPAEFYDSAGFVRVGDEQTLFGPAPSLRRDVTFQDR